MKHRRSIPEQPSPAVNRPALSGPAGHPAVPLSEPAERGTVVSAHIGCMTNIDNTPDGMSTNDYLATLPVRRRSYEAGGQLLLMPRLGLVVVPHTKHASGWDVVVVAGNSTYPRGGYDLFLGALEIETATELFDQNVLLASAAQAMPVPVNQG